MGRNRGFYRCLSISRPIHAIRKSTMRDWRSGGIADPFGTFHHFDRQSRQQQAQACCALNTGCPRIGVCLPSLGGFVRARRVRMKSSQWHTRRLSGVATHREATAPKRKRGRADRLQAFVRDVLPVRFRKAEPAAKLGLRKPLERCISRCHHFTTISSSQRVEARFESFVLFIFHDFSPMPSEAENTLPLP